MNLIELHMLQSFPVTCLNRDQFGSPKSVVFGGAPRARVSSQCWKRAIRLFAKDECEMFSGYRTKEIIDVMAKMFQAQQIDEETARENAKAFISVSKMSIEKKNGKEKCKNLFYFSLDGMRLAVEAFLQTEEKAKKDPSFAKKMLEDNLEDDEAGDENTEENTQSDSATKKKKGKKTEALDTGKKAAALAARNVFKRISKDGVDIAFFGRMVAKTPLTLDGAAMFSHAVSVNRVDNDLDFFTAIDDLIPGETASSSQLGDIEFNSACYYRYVALNLDLLADSDHLSVLSLEERKQAVATFLKACVMANPSARKNSMMGYSLPGFILGVSRKGSPLTLVNAFETPVKGVGLLDQAEKVLKNHWNQLKTTYGIDTVYEKALPAEVNLNAMIEGLVGYVK